MILFYLFRARTEQNKKCLKAKPFITNYSVTKLAHHFTQMELDCLEEISIEDFLNFNKKGSNSLDRWADWFNKLSHLTASQVCLVRAGLTFSSVLLEI